MAIKQEQISIANRWVDRLEDENGQYWYPLKSFCKRILLKYIEPATYRDSTFIQYMKVFEFKPIDSCSRVKTWCVNEKGIKRLLKNFTIGKGRTDDLNELRRKNLTEACLYFGIDRAQELAPTYINIPPKLTDYDVWSILCFRYDEYINKFTKWCKCKDCEYYYPHTANYFEKSRSNKLSRKCLQCAGKNFKCQNQIIQFIYDNNGLDLLYAIDNLADDTVIVDKLTDFINLGGTIKNDY